ncbi:pseudaminic acid cytidylyltransferase, partial [Desulfobacteraceae bacterium SEEP-SAG9]
QKNIRLFCGKPIIAYSIETAIRTKLFDRIIVSTDSNEIAEVASEYDAETPFLRPAELSDDYATTASVILHSLEWLGKNNVEVTHLCCIYGTAPMIRAGDIIE